LVKQISLARLALVLFFSASVFANVTVSINGTYQSTTLPGTYSAPSAPWTLSFQVANPPAVSGVTSFSFDTTYTNAVFTLNGASVPVTGSQVYFSFFGTNSVMNVSLDALSTFGVGAAPQLFTGTPSSPTLTLGSFPVSQVSMTYSGGEGSQSSLVHSNLLLAQSASPAPTATPAPSSVIMAAIGLAGLALLEMLRRKQSAA
jgi:MYXO-CTERM domain-containing protein